MNEATLLRIIQEACPSPQAPWGIGDDCATISQHNDDYVFKVDSIIEHVHFTLNMNPELIGRKAICRVISDFAAMGGAMPIAFLVSITLSSRHDAALVSSIYKGMAQTLETYGGKLVGGETSHYKETHNKQGNNSNNDIVLPLNISISGLASINSDLVVTRQGGNPGDAIFVTGELGYPLASEHHLHFEPRLKQAQWLANHNYASSMMDLSDGLAMDLPRLCQQSCCHYQLDLSSIPCVESSSIQQAVSLGEDYELLFTVPATKVEELSQAWSQQFPDLKLSHIGSLCDLTIPNSPELEGGWDCFNG